MNEASWAIETLEIERHRLLGEQRHRESMALHFLDDRIKPSKEDDEKRRDVEAALDTLRGRS